MRRKNSDPVDLDDEANKGKGIAPTVVESSSMSSPEDTVKQLPIAERRRSSQGALWNREDSRQIKKIEYPMNRSLEQRKRFRNRLYIGGLTLLLLTLVGVTIGLYDVISSLTEATKLKKTTIVLPPNDKIPKELLSGVTRGISEVPIVLSGILRLSRHLKPGEFHYPVELLEHEYFGFYYPEELDDESYDEGKEADYGPIDIKFITEENQRRNIYGHLSERQGNARAIDQARDDDVEPYWMDDDFVRNPYFVYDDDEIRYQRRCRKTSWHKYQFPSCNVVHEISLLENHPTFVGEGAYREVFIIDKPYLDTEEQVAVKELRYDLGMMYDDYEYIRVDSMITERMTSNPQIVNLYAFCGFTMLTECFSNGDVEEDVVGFDDRDMEFRPEDESELTPRNNFTGIEKLQLALSMVEPVAALHNFKDGVIVHDDIQLSQYLWTDDTKSSVKLNDFNRAEVMFWDEKHQEYCKYRNGRGHGDWRAPEEYRNDPLDEKIDIWSLCNNFYSLLTGCYPFYDVEDSSYLKIKIARGHVPRIDPRYLYRSFAERKLVGILHRCYVADPEERIDINELQALLEDAIAEDNHRRELGIVDEYYPEEEEYESTSEEDESRDVEPEDYETYHDDVVEQEEPTSDGEKQEEQYPVDQEEQEGHEEHDSGGKEELQDSEGKEQQEAHQESVLEHDPPFPEEEVDIALEK